MMEKLTYKKTNIDVYYSKLDSGLGIYVLPIENTREFYLTCNVKVGSVHTDFKSNKEYKMPNGTAHFLEHKLFEIGETNAFKTFSDLGLEVNAYTTYDYTCYEVSGNTHIKEALNNLLRLVRCIKFTKEGVEKEKGIIKNEIDIYDDIPSFRVHNEYEYNLNIKDKHKYKVSGTKDDIDSIKYEDLIRLYDTFYTPDNMFLVLVGNVKPLEVDAIIRKFEQSKDTHKYECKLNTFNEPLEVHIKKKDTYMGTFIPKVKYGFKMSKKPYKNIDRLDIYLNILLEIKFGKSSDFYEKVTSLNKLTSDLTYSIDIRDNYISISFLMDTEYKDELILLIKEELNNKNIKEEDLTRVKNIFISDFFYSLNNLVDICNIVRDDILAFNSIDKNKLNVYDDISLNTIKNILNNLDLNTSLYVQIK